MTGIVQSRVIDTTGAGKAGSEISCTVGTCDELITGSPLVEAIAFVGDELAVDDTGVDHGRSLLRDCTRSQVIKDNGSVGVAKEVLFVLLSVQRLHAG